MKSMAVMLVYVYSIVVSLMTLRAFSQVFAVLLTRPTYQGVLMNGDAMRRIISYCHSKKIPVIVDEAHGGHLRFLEDPALEG